MLGCLKAPREEAQAEGGKKRRTSNASASRRGSVRGGPPSKKSGSDSNTESETELSKQEAKINAAHQAFKAHIREVDSFFTRNANLLGVEVVPPTAKQKAVCGPDDKLSPVSHKDKLYGCASSNYPKKAVRKGEEPKGEKLGDPVCDAFAYQFLVEASDDEEDEDDEGKDMILMTVADGCNWGPKPFEAAHISCSAFLDFVSSNAKDLKNVRAVASTLLKGFAHAHTKIMEAPIKRGIKDVWETGTTTLLGCVLLRLEEEAAKTMECSHVLVAANIGDCKAFHYNLRERRVTDLTTGNRPADSPTTNVNDPGGRLGPYVGQNGEADLRNLAAFAMPCRKGDLIILATDGITDNLDPQQLGLHPHEVNLECATWEEADVKDSERAKDEYRIQFLANLAKGGKPPVIVDDQGEQDEGQDDEGKAGENDEGSDKEGTGTSSSSDESEEDGTEKKSSKKQKGKQKAKKSDDKKKKNKHKKKGDETEAEPNLQRIAQALINHADQITRFSREWMEANPTERMPDERSRKKNPKFRGKMDHGTILLFRV